MDARWEVSVRSYDLSTRGDLPLYEYLYRCIRDDITGGTIAARDRLPSRRALAERLGVSVVTVEGAYRQLVAEGYVEARPRSGFFVASLPSRRGHAAASSSRACQVCPPAPQSRRPWRRLGEKSLPSRPRAPLDRRATTSRTARPMHPPARPGSGSAACATRLPTSRIPSCTRSRPRVGFSGCVRPSRPTSSVHVA